MGDGVPIGQITRGADLTSPGHANVRMAAAHHGKAVGMMKVGAALEQRHRLSCGIDEVVVFVTFGRRRPHAKDAALTVQHKLDPGRQVIGRRRGHANAQIDLSTIPDILRHAPGQLLFASFLIAHFRLPY